MDSLCVTIVWGKIDSECGEREYSCQYHDGVIPTKGAKFSFWTSRDEYGNYRKDGDVRLLVSGTVDSVEYLYEVNGKDSFSNRQTMYVTVILADAVIGDAWDVGINQ